MKVIKKHLYILLIFTTSCIQDYNLTDEVGFEPSIVVDGLLTNKNEQQTIKLSTSSNPTSPSFQPLSGCMVRVYTNENNYEFIEARDGNYIGFIPGNEFLQNNSFTLEFITENGEKYISNTETVGQNIKIDSIYYKHDQEYLDLNDDKPTKGIRFFIDVEVNSGKSSYAKYELTETYEYHSTYPITWVYENHIMERYAPDFSLFVCYQKTKLNKIFLLSSENTNSSKLVDIPLHFVENSTQKLRHKYILTLNQFSISKQAYEYWSRLVENNQETGGINDGQPLNVKGNVKKADDPSAEVLGYFGVSVVKQKRIYIEEVPGLEFPPIYDCLLTTADLSGLGKTTENDWPLYFTEMPMSDDLGTANKSCYDCTANGGTTVKPDYWDEK